MTDREKLIELLCDGTLKTEICTADTHLECETCKGDCGYCTILADHLIDNGVTVQRHGRWIPVSKPPKRFERVLVYYPQKDYGSKYVVDYNEVESNKVPYFAEQHRFGKPTHWMPLPEPPKESEA